MKSLSRVWLLATPWTAVHQGPPSMGFSRQEYWSGVPLSSLKWPLLFFFLILWQAMSQWWCDHYLEPDILECEVKWALGSITVNKASGSEGIPAKLFQILKKWCCESAALNMLANLENSAVATGLENVSFHSNPKERQGQRMFKLLHNCTHLTC